MESWEPNKLTVAIDYDDTFTADVAAWSSVIRILQDAGHRVVCITARNGTDGNRREVTKAMPNGVCVLFAYGYQKREFAVMNGVTVDIWIDDLPEAIPSKQDLASMCC